jgi:hypothetical protein
MAKEPSTWSTLFSNDALAVKPRQRTVSSMLKSYRYATSNFGASVAATACTRLVEERKQCKDPKDADWNAYSSVVEDFIKAANEDRVMEFFKEAPAAQRTELRTAWFEMTRTAGTNVESTRD